MVANVWKQMDLGLNVSRNLGSVTSNDIEYIRDNIYPFLQLVNSDITFSEEFPVEFITSNPNFVIHNYGDAIAISVLRSNIATQIAAAVEIARIIVKEKKWNKIEMVDGTPTLQRILWIESQKHGFVIEGYDQNDGDKKCYDRITKQAETNGVSSGYQSN